jgi:hypothetical protein
MQSGVTLEIADGVATDTSPKHLRVGVNSAMVEHSALALLLIEKGIFTGDKYERALADAMERERDLYQERASARHGKRITLG